MSIVVFGAGAVGSLIAAHLALGGHGPTLIARGPQRAAIAENGLIVDDGARRRVARLEVSDDPASLGPQRVVILALKAHQIAAALDGIRALLSPWTAVVTAVNGIPWWFDYRGDPGPTGADAWLKAVDPGGSIWTGLGPERAIGCLAHCASRVVEPGLVRAHGRPRLVLGEPTGRDTQRLEDLAATLDDTELAVEVADDIRQAVWRKLYGNLIANPLSVLSGLACGPMVADPGLARLMARVLAEAERVAAATGTDLPGEAEARIRKLGRMGDFKTSMLQDFERGRTIELDPILGAVIELAGRHAIETPILETVYTLTRLKAGFPRD